MKPSNRKWILLVVLTAIMIYVWWGNYQQFYGEQAHQPTVPGEEMKTSATLSGSAAIAYTPPKINPFRKFASRVRPAADDSRRRTEQPEQPLVPPLSSEYSLTGILTDEDRPQAVIRGPGFPSRVVTVGDSLGNWKILQVKANSIICLQGDKRDTLWYGEPDSH